MPAPVDEEYESPEDKQRMQVYRAMQHAAQQLGLAQYTVQRQQHLKKGRSPKTFRYAVTDAHQQLVNGIHDLMNEKITPEQGMAMLHEHDINKERFEVEK